MTKTQNESLKESINRWNRVNAKVKLVGENEDGKLICTLETSHHIQYFLIGKKGAFTWKNKYIKIEA